MSEWWQVTLVALVFTLVLWYINNLWIGRIEDRHEEIHRLQEFNLKLLDAIGRGEALEE